MMLVSSAASPKRRRPIVFATRSFPPLYGPSSASSPANGTSLRNGKSPSIADGGCPPDPTSCVPVASLGGNVFKRPAVFAIRNFPRACSPLGPAPPKPSYSKEASLEFSKGNLNHKRNEQLAPENVNQLSKKTLSAVRTFPDGCRLDGSETKVEVQKEFTKTVGEVSKGVRGVVSDTQSEGGDKIGFVDSAREVSKRGKVSTVRTSPNRCKPDVSKDNNEFEVKKKLLDNVRNVPKEGHKLGRDKEKGAQKFSSKLLLIPDRVKDCVSPENHPLEVRGDRLIVQALMASPYCPWRQGKRKTPSVVQPNEKKP